MSTLLTSVKGKAVELLVDPEGVIVRVCGEGSDGLELHDIVQRKDGWYCVRPWEKEKGPYATNVSAARSVMQTLYSIACDNSFYYERLSMDLKDDFELLKDSPVQ